MPLDFLLSVIRHPKTPAALQVKVSLATLPYIHPKQSSRPPKPVFSGFQDEEGLVLGRMV
jgi:hypothetical protein